MGSKVPVMISLTLEEDEPPIKHEGKKGKPGVEVGMSVATIFHVDILGQFFT